eukprot:scaffold46967_cov52-Attheya_sp.AAC.5
MKCLYNLLGDPDHCQVTDYTFKLRDPTNGATFLSAEKAVAMVDMGMERSTERKSNYGLLCGKASGVVNVEPQGLDKGSTQDHKGTLEQCIEEGYMCGEALDELLDSGLTKGREPLPICRDCYDSGMNLVFSAKATNFKTQGQEDKLQKEKKRKTLEAAGKRPLEVNLGINGKQMGYFNIYIK